MRKSVPGSSCWFFWLPALILLGSPVHARGPSEGDSEGTEELRLPRGGFGEYADQLERVSVKTESAGDLRIQIRVIPDSFYWNLSRGMQELERANYKGNELEKKLKDLYRKNKSEKGYGRFLVSLSGGGGDVHYFFQKTLKSHFVLRAPTKKTISFKNEKEMPGIEKWSIFGYPPNRQRFYFRDVPLRRFQKANVVLATKLSRLKRNEPVKIDIGGILRTEKSDDPRNSMNLSLRQISCVEMKQIELPRVTVTFYPGKWDLPEPPEEFLNLLTKLGLEP